MGVITRFLFVKGTSVTHNQKVNSKISLINKARIGSAIDTPLSGLKQAQNRLKTGSKQAQGAAHKTNVAQHILCDIQNKTLIYKAMLHL